MSITLKLLGNAWKNTKIKIRNIRKIGGFEKFAEWGLIRCNQRNFNDMN